MKPQRQTIGYIRKSTDTEDKQIRSLEDQEKLIKDHYLTLPEEERQYPLRIMSESKSAFRPGRPGFNEIMQMAKNGEAYRMIVLDPTRLSRNPEDTGRLVQCLTDGHMEDVMTVTGKTYNRADTGQLFMLTLESTMSWKDSADKSIRVSQTMKAKAKEGGTTGPAPIGYKNVGEVRGRRMMDVDPKTAPQIQRLFHLAATGAYSLEALCTEARVMGLRTRPTKKYPEGLQVQKTTLYHILRNHAYKGIKVYMNEKYPAKHQSIVDTETWERVQMELTARSTGASAPKDLTLRELFIMAGCVRCGNCKVRTMSPYKVKKGRYIVYECKNPKTKCCNCINQDKLLAQLYEEVSRLRIEDDEFEHMKRTLKADHVRQNENLRDSRASLEKEYREVEQQITDVFMHIEEARKHGVYDTVSMRLSQLKMRKDELWNAMENIHDTGDAWVDHAIRCFELVKLTQRALQVGTTPKRTAVLKSLSSSYEVRAGKLYCNWFAPFQQKAEEGCRTNWLDVVQMVRINYDLVMDVVRKMQI